jgi:hypothetical protein
VIVTLPSVTPVTVPVGDTVPTAASLVLHTPPLTELVSTVVVPVQRFGVPDIAETLFTVIVFVAALPQPVL